MTKPKQYSPRERRLFAFEIESYGNRYTLLEFTLTRTKIGLFKIATYDKINVTAAPVPQEGEKSRWEDDLSRRYTTLFSPFGSDFALALHHFAQLYTGSEGFRKPYELLYKTSDGCVHTVSVSPSPATRDGEVPKTEFQYFRLQPDGTQDRWRKKNVNQFKLRTLLNDHKEVIESFVHYGSFFTEDPKEAKGLANIIGLEIMKSLVDQAKYSFPRSGDLKDLHDWRVYIYGDVYNKRREKEIFRIYADLIHLNNLEVLYKDKMYWFQIKDMVEGPVWDYVREEPSSLDRSALQPMVDAIVPYISGLDGYKRWTRLPYNTRPFSIDRDIVPNCLKI